MTCLAFSQLALTKIVNIVEKILSRENVMFNSHHNIPILVQTQQMLFRNENY